MLTLLRRSALALLLLLAGSAHADGRKVGFVWIAELHPCSADAAQASWPVVTVGNPTGQTLYVESLRIFTGMSDPGLMGQADVSVALETYDGQLIEWVGIDKYASPGGAGDVTTLRQYRTPWRFKKGAGVVARIFCYRWGQGAGGTTSGGSGAAWLHVAVMIEGFVE